MFGRELRGDSDPAVPLNLLTTKQRTVLMVVDRYTTATGEPCSARYLARRLNLHHSTVLEHLSVLYRKGWLRTPNAPAMLRRPAR